MTSAAELVAAFAAGAARPSDAAASALAAARSSAPKVFTELLEDQALSDAAASDRRWARQQALGPLDGVPVAVKDLMHVAGTVPTLGSAVHPTEPSAFDAEAVRRLRDAGALVIGRTWTHEHAWGITGQHPVLGGPANPYDPTRVTGGSSAGSAVAVASGVVPLALGTDTAGSVRIPAAWCGVMGWKPSHGWASLEGVFELARSFDHLGLFATTVDDLVTAHQGLADRPLGLVPDPASLRIASALQTPVADPAIGAHLAEVHQRLGLPVVELPDTERTRVTQATLQPVEALRVHRDLQGWWPERREQFGVNVSSRLEMAEAITLEEVAVAEADKARIAADLEACMDGADVVVAPVVGCAPSFVDDPDVAPLPGDVPLRDAVLGHSSLQTLLGLPALCLPAGTVAGLPVGVQLFARRDDDALVLAAAYALAPALAA
jgi:aspartyl-tRNA(Asn)/glutamyl-tRNA(Gln) amidotransferase subunit A